MTDHLYITWPEVYERLKGAPGGRLYGIPRGGQIVAGLTGRAVDRIEDADVLVDDIVDSGRTRKEWAKYKLPFWSLVDKIAEGVTPWVHFPWEREPDVDVEHNVVRLLEMLGEDPNRDGLRDTPRRVIKSLRDLTSGYRQDPQEILARVFDVDHDALITLDHIEFTSLCEHHMLPFFGHAHIGYIPRAGRGVVGISKLARLVDCFARRLQVQERMTRQVAEAIQGKLDPVGVAVVIEAKHHCVCARGVGKQNSMMRTSTMLGVMREAHEARAEFLQIIQGG